MDVKRDPVEETAEFKAVYPSVASEADRILAEQGEVKGRGYINKFWPVVKRLLKEKHGIDWKSPGELNAILFD